MSKKYDVDYIRDQFPALKTIVKGKLIAALDAPGGSQVPVRVVEKISEYLYYHNANEHGMFGPSHKTEELVEDAREVFAQFFNCKPTEVGFGANSTTNNFLLAHAIRRDLKAGDEVIITDIDHLCNRSPWKQLEEIGVVVKSVAVNPQTCQLDFEDYKKKLSKKTKVVALNYASNAVGTITDVKKYIELAHEVGAITVVDAVHYAAHRPIDVKEINTDILICSAYKFFGPHIGIIYVRDELFEALKTIKVDADDILEIPVKFQTGTPNFEHICGAAEAVRFIADIGEQFGDDFHKETGHLSGLRKNIVKGILAYDHHEETIAYHLREELRKISGVTIYGPAEGEERTTTVSFTIDGMNANAVSERLGEEGIYTWDGDYYAVILVNDVLKLADVGGMLRVGLAPYNTMEDINRTLTIVRELANN